MKFLLPYDKKWIPIEIDDRNFAGSLVSKVESYQPGLSQQELVEASLDHTIGSPRLEELVKGKKKHCHCTLGPHPSRAFQDHYTHPSAADSFSATVCKHKDFSCNRLSSPIHSARVG
jgi:hypothetical protein